MRGTLKRKGIAVALVMSMLCSTAWTGRAHAEEQLEDTEAVVEVTATDTDAPAGEDTEELQAFPETNMDGLTVETNGVNIGKHLFKTAEGYELLGWKNHTLTLERYDNSLNLTGSSVIDSSCITPPGASVSGTQLGGIYEGQDYNFVVTGQNNYNQSDTVCTLRVAKFSKAWSFLGACNISKQDNVEIYEVFDFGGFDMVEQGGNLWISMGRTGYGSVHHQGKMSVLVRISDMTIQGSSADFWHSFSQFETVCNGRVYQCEMSEGNRGIYVERLNADKYTGGWNYNWLAGSDAHVSILDCWSSDEYGMWSYALYANTGDFTSSDTYGRLLATYTTVDQKAVQQNKDNARNLPENLWAASVSTDMQDVKQTQISNISDPNVSIDYTYTVKLNDNKFVVIWNQSKYNSASWSNEESVQYAVVDANGNRLTDIRTVNAELDTSHPVNVGNGTIAWAVESYNYKTEDYDTVFYTLNVDASTISVKNPNAQETSQTPSNNNLDYKGIYLQKADQTGVTAIMDVSYSGSGAGIDYCWYATKDDGKTWIRVTGWNQNRYINWKPSEYGDYILVGKVRENGNDAGVIQKAVNFSFHPEIKGICQMPYTGPGGGYLMGVESFNNPGNSYSYEMLILDCTLLAQNKPAWVYTTGRCKTGGNCLWTVWQPQYGYYWTLFRVYDGDGNLIDERCYPFVNAY